MTRGFVTLATGNVKYYNMALNMLNSFRIHNPDVPFAIVCDRENEVTEKFDDVVVLEKANGDYRDKFSLLVNSPYDENIFIEPDCLIYRNLDFFWELLSDESDFSSFGWNNGGIDCWFKTEETKSRLLELVPELQGKTDAPLFNPGYLFIRKGEKCRKMYEECLSVAERIMGDELLSKDPSILCSGKLRDDPIFNIGMAINGFICNAKPKVAKCISLPSKYKINRIDIIKGVLDVTDKNGKEFSDCALLHFSTRKANEEGLYLWQKVLIDSYNNKKVLIKILNNGLAGIVFSVFRFIKTRVKRVLKA
ncbi:MAG: hypothetical protein IKB08_07890 [Clostridia bacterium]|nr:hypothetical protein [Clostridia bacterium]